MTPSAADSSDIYLILLLKQENEQAFAAVLALVKSLVRPLRRAFGVPAPEAAVLP
jgi:hypothetical protein